MFPYVLRRGDLIMISLNMAGLLAATCLGAVAVNWETATLQLNDAGRVVALQDNVTGHNYAVGKQPFCRIVTDDATLEPSDVSQSDNQISFTFPGNASLTFRVISYTGFSLWQVQSIKGLNPEKVQILDLCTLNLDELPTLGARLNACYDDNFAAAVMATQINVHGFAIPSKGKGGNLTGVEHTFRPSGEQAAEGNCAANFTATSSRDTKDGWSVRGRSINPSLNLVGLQAIKVWIHGDGKGEQLKIQLSDGKGGYRDDYIPIDFTGWREVICDTPALNTADYSRISRINFYYNGLPANTTVKCGIDHVRAVIQTDQDLREVVLENFEDSDSELWDRQGVSLKAKSYKKFKIMPAGFGIIACPRKLFETTIDAFEKATDLPNPHPGGAWSKQSPWTKQSYLFITSSGEKDVDEVITWAKRGGFRTILILGSDWSKSHGHHEINRKRFPDGLPSLQRTVAKYRQAGFRVGLHFLGAAVFLSDPYVWPIPDPRLVKDAWTELAADVDEKTDFIPTVGPPQGFPAEDGGYRGQGTFVQIGDELIQYGKLQTEPPYGFADCKRGAARTNPAAHERGTRIGHMKRSFGYFLYDLDSTLATEVIGNVCKVANAINADMLYFDGSEWLQGEHWYYNAKLQSLYYNKLENKNTFLQGSSYSHFSWHLHSRHASADGRGNIKGYLDERMPGFASRSANMMPLDIGWYYVYDQKVTADQFEYVLQKCLGFGSSISVQTSAQKLREHPEMGPIFDLVRTYDQLRLSGKVPEAVRKLLREPGREYRLLNDPLRLKRIVYQPWQEVRELDGKQNVWTTDPVMAGVRLGIQIRCGSLLGDKRKQATTEKAKLIEPQLKIGDRMVTFPVTLNEGERLVWFPGEQPEIIPAKQGKRHKLAEMQPSKLADPTRVTFMVTKPLSSLAEVRLVQDCPEEHLLQKED